jgi:hypothetical protein
VIQLNKKTQVCLGFIYLFVFASASFYIMLRTYCLLGCYINPAIIVVAKESRRGVFALKKKFSYFYLKIHQKLIKPYINYLITPNTTKSLKQKSLQKSIK